MQLFYFHIEFKVNLKNNKNVKIGLRITLAVMGIIAVAAGIFILIQVSKPKAYLITDSSWSVTLPEEQVTSLKNFFASKGFSMKTDKPDSVEMIEHDGMVSFLSSFDDGKIIFFSPAVTAAIQVLDINVAELFEGLTIGIGYSNDSGAFDLILVSDTETGWNQIGETDAILCRDNDPVAKDFRKKTENKYIVDYRYSQVVPVNNLKGIISPDLVMSVEPYISDYQAGEKETGKLYYEYREI